MCGIDFAHFVGLGVWLFHTIFPTFASQFSGPFYRNPSGELLQTPFVKNPQQHALKLNRKSPSNAVLLNATIWHATFLLQD